MVIHSQDSSQLQDANRHAEREDWPREKLLVRRFPAPNPGIVFAEAIVLVR